jgi:3alpha(or 20beta)-hydroxysteroid dehydrogenase
MTGRLAGRVALVTGAARGMGAAEVRLFCEEGAAVVAADVRPEVLVLAAEVGARALTLDVASEEAWREAISICETEHGRLDVLVNNAGIGGRHRNVVDLALDDYLEVVGVNQVGVFLGMKHAAPLMARGGGGSIVNISSTNGLVGAAHSVAYVASKFAVRGMTKAAAIDLGPVGIRVNSIHPGGIETPLLTAEGRRTAEDVFPFSRLPAGRVGQPEDVARLALFLASDESRYCTGAEFVVDGGMTCGPPVRDDAAARGAGS